jgi:hypothetical protein
MATDSDRAYWYGYFVARGGRDGYVHSDTKSEATRKDRTPLWLDYELQPFRKMDEYVMGYDDGRADDLDGAPNPIRGFDARPDLVTGSDVITSIDLIRIGMFSVATDDEHTDIHLIGQIPCPGCQADAVEWEFNWARGTTKFISCASCNQLHSTIAGSDYEFAGERACDDISSLTALDLATEPYAS